MPSGFGNKTPFFPITAVKRRFRKMGGCRSDVTGQSRHLLRLPSFPTGRPLAFPALHSSMGHTAPMKARGRAVSGGRLVLGEPVSPVARSDGPLTPAAGISYRYGLITLARHLGSIDTT